MPRVPGRAVGKVSARVPGRTVGKVIARMPGRTVGKVTGREVARKPGKQLQAARKAPSMLRHRCWRESNAADSPRRTLATIRSPNPVLPDTSGTSDQPTTRWDRSSPIALSRAQLPYGFSWYAGPVADSSDPTRPSQTKRIGEVLVRRRVSLREERLHRRSANEAR